MRVLVPIDETRASEAALTEAVRLVAGTDDGAIILVTVGALAETSAQADSSRAALGKRLTSIAARLAPLPVETRVELAGDPVQGILDVAGEVHADRIVMATEHEGFWEALADGRGVSGEVTNRAALPVRVLDMRQSDID